MNVKRFVANSIGENCYLVWDDMLECAIIDCGAYGDAKEEKIAHFIEENHLHPRFALQTHMHFDHMFGLPLLYRLYGLRPLCHTLEQPVYDFAPTMAREWFDMEVTASLIPVDSYLTDGQEMTLGQTHFRVLHTPGHTPGGLCFYFPEDKLLFTGDTLFQFSIGRADLPGGSAPALINSIRTKILTLPDDVRVFPGHGPESTVGEERRFNPYL